MITYGIIYQASPTPGRINEDSYYYCQFESTITLLVADGATQRIELPQLAGLIDSEEGVVNGATLASRTIRDVTATHFRSSPAAILTEANNVLRRKLESVYERLDAQSVLALEPHLQELLQDPRMLRLALPVSVATVVQIDLKTRKLQYAHAGDTCLLIEAQNGEILELSDDQMRQHDVAALKLALEIKTKKAHSTFKSATTESEVQKRNIENAIYHNFVNTSEQPDRNVGVGVINGLPFLEHYIQTGEYDLRGMSALFMSTDGALLPATLNENDQERHDRYKQIFSSIRKFGINEYLTQLRELEIQDSELDRYPRFKQHDDATAIYLELGHE